MKTTVSIPDDLLETVPKVARRMRKSRSRIFSEALKEYIVRREPDEITRALNRVYAHVGAQDSAFLTAAARRILRRSEW